MFYGIIETVITLTWAAFAPTTDKAPDTDNEINVEHAASIYIQIDTTTTENVSDDNDINVQSSPDGVVWDTEPYAECNIGDNQIKSFLVEPGPRRIRLRADNNHATANAAITCKVLVRK